MYVYYPTFRPRLYFFFASRSWSRVPSEQRRVCCQLYPGWQISYLVSYNSQTVRFKTVLLFPTEALYTSRLAAYLLANLSPSIAVNLKFLKPIIEERLRKIDEYGLDYPEKPVSSLSQSIWSKNNFYFQQDLITWMLDVAEGVERSPEHLAFRALNLNFAAIHTSSIVLFLSSHFGIND